MTSCHYKFTITASPYSSPKKNQWHCSSVRVKPPPSDYSIDSLRATSREYVKIMYPQLLTMVETGSLIVYHPDSSDTDTRPSPKVIFLIGTTHISTASCNEVKTVIESVRPDNVVVELCRSRAGLMYDVDPSETSSNPKSLANLMSLSGDGFVSTISRSLALGGRSALLFRLLLGKLSKKMKLAEDMEVGAEFKAARIAAESVGAQLVLGDRPMEITLQRAWRGLGWKEKIKLCQMFILSSGDAFKVDTSKEALEALKSDDTLSAMFSAISSQFPSLVASLIHERDTYLAWSLKRSKAVKGCDAVVGVVGRGHLRGVAYALTHHQENLRFKHLVGARESSYVKSVKIVRNVAIETVVALAAYVAFTNLFS